MRLILSSLNYSLFEDSERTDISLRFDINAIEALQEQFQTKVDSAFKLSQIGFTRNEINDKLQLGFEKKPWGDSWWAPLNQIPVNEDTEDTVPDPPPAPAPEKPAEDDADAGKLYGGKRLKRISAPSPAKASAPLPVAKTGRTELRTKQLEAMWKTHIAKIQPYEDAYRRKLKAVLFSARRKTLALLYDQKRGLEGYTPEEFKEILPKALHDLEAIEFQVEADLMEDFGKRVYQEVMIVGSDSAASEIGVEYSFNLRNPAVAAFMERKLIRVREPLIEVAENIRSLCTEAVVSGWTVPELAREIRNEFNELAGWRTNAIARTEMVGASNFGRSVMIKNSGFGKREWFTAGDEKVRPEHLAMDGEKVGMDEPWVVDGYDLNYPGDVSGPDYLVINCRCIEVVDPDSGLSEE